MTGFFVWLKNSQDPPVFWPIGHSMAAAEIRDVQRATLGAWIYLGNYEVVSP